MFWKKKQKADEQGRVPWIIDGRAVVTVTHPQQPNHSGNARGRKVHLAKSDKVSICNMLIDERMLLWPGETTPTSSMAERKCKVCFAPIIKI